MKGIALIVVAVLAVAAARSHRPVLAFEKLTGYPHGRVGYVVDHIIPLCAGGADTPANMQWQTKADSYRKDRWERAFCRALTIQRMKLVQIA